MSKIKNGGLDQYGAEPFKQPQFLTVGVEGSGVDTGGSGGSMNRGPRAPGGPSAEPQKFHARK